MHDAIQLQSFGSGLERQRRPRAEKWELGLAVLRRVHRGAHGGWRADLSVSLGHGALARLCEDVPHRSELRGRHHWCPEGQRWQDQCSQAGGVPVLYRRMELYREHGTWDRMVLGYMGPGLYLVMAYAHRLGAA